MIREVDRASMCLSSPAALGSGGLGQHAEQVLAVIRAQARNDVRCFAADSGETGVSAVDVLWTSFACRWTPLRFAKAYHAWLGGAEFDRSVSRLLPRGDRFIGFAGAAYRSFLAARAKGYSTLELESPTAHVTHARHMYELAHRQYPIEASWLCPALVRRTLIEYEMADVIWVNSDYSWQTFVDQGVPAAKLRRRYLTAGSRFVPATSPRPQDGLTRYVYVGSLSTNKGVPLLIDAISGLNDDSISLTLVGGYGSRGMRKLIEATLRRDRRVHHTVGDPLPYLHGADVFVFPSYSDGLGLAALEAIACGLQVIITKEAGASACVTSTNGMVIEAGSLSALREALLRMKERVSQRAA